MKANIFVTLKREVLDPQGDAVRRSLSSLGFEEVKSARVGKLIELELDGNDKASAESHIQSMCEKLLANPVIEDFSLRNRGVDLCRLVLPGDCGAADASHGLRARSLVLSHPLVTRMWWGRGHRQSCGWFG